MKKPSTTVIPDLTNFTESQLLKVTFGLGILAEANGKLTTEQQRLLTAVNEEFQRRDRLVLFPAQLENKLPA